MIVFHEFLILQIIIFGNNIVFRFWTACIKDCSGDSVVDDIASLRQSPLHSPHKYICEYETRFVLV